MTARSHSSMNRDCLFILAAISSMKIQLRKSTCNILCIICAYLQSCVLIKYIKSYLKFNDKSLTKVNLSPNIRLKQGGMSPQNK